MKYIKAVAFIILLVLLDQWTKMLAVTHLKNQSPIPIIKDIFELHYLENTGAAFGVLQGRQLFFFIGTFITIAAIIVLYVRMPHTKKYLPMRICMILIVAGAFGNMIDRISQQYVVDFLYFKAIDFPIFNVADCYVTCSIFIVAVLILFVYKDEDLDFLSFRKKKEGESN